MPSQRQGPRHEQTADPPPLAVLAAALMLPASGQIINRQPFRGLTFVFFFLLLGGFTLKTAAPDVSVIGKFAGGIFVYAMSVFDAYKQSRIRTTVWLHQNRQA